ncbi:hypothetical protein M3J09_011888 [Ascochyta lentis]
MSGVSPPTRRLCLVPAVSQLRGALCCLRWCWLQTCRPADSAPSLVESRCCVVSVRLRPLALATSWSAAPLQHLCSTSAARSTAPPQVHHLTAPLIKQSMVSSAADTSKVYAQPIPTSMGKACMAMSKFDVNGRVPPHHFQNQVNNRAAVDENMSFRGILISNISLT